MFLATPPSANLSRRRLRQLAAWIRDDLDPTIAQEGPDKLRADDVLTLHEVFQALGTSATITALDLRATGIHKAVMEVAGLATRWPGRLADDCDRIIMAWTNKFGRLENLHPFMYGRGGRLEGIASADEVSKAALLKRWQATCPHKISSKRSHRPGDISFKAGAWWMNPLLACHAGIIDLDSIDGGVCFDKHGAYAVLLKSTGEVEAPDETHLTYRPRQNDQGKFRLTSANARSKHPIRILRCHSLNSVWGPKAGVRYEGLYRITGWIVRTAKFDDVIGREYKAGNIIFEIKFERIDPVPMAEVLKHPTSHELDDYTEYKRLRRIHREEYRRHPIGYLDRAEDPANTVPPVSPTDPIVSYSHDLPKATSGPARSTTFKDPVATILGPRRLLTPGPSRPLPAETKSSPASDIFDGAEIKEPLLESPGPILYLSSAPTASRHILRGKSELSHNESNAGSDKTSAHPSRESGLSHPGYIREPERWIDYDLERTATATSISKRSNRPQQGSGPPSSEIMARSETRRKSASRATLSDTSESVMSAEKEWTSSKGPEGKARRPEVIESKIKDDRNEMVTHGRSRNPLAKLFDGTSRDGAWEPGNDYFSQKAIRSASFGSRPSSKIVERHARASSSAGTTCPLSPIPIRPLSPFSTLITSHRDAASFPSGFETALGTNRKSRDDFSALPIHDPFVDASDKQSKFSHQPISLKSFISEATTATPLGVKPSISSIISSRSYSSVGPSQISHSIATSLPVELRNWVLKTELHSSEEQIVFKNPFEGSRHAGTILRRASSDEVEHLSPDMSPEAAP